MTGFLLLVWSVGHYAALDDSHSSIRPWLLAAVRVLVIMIVAGFYGVSSRYMPAILLFGLLTAAIDLLLAKSEAPAHGAIMYAVHALCCIMLFLVLPNPPVRMDLLNAPQFRNIASALAIALAATRGGNHMVRCILHPAFRYAKSSLLSANPASTLAVSQVSAATEPPAGDMGNAYYESPNASYNLGALDYRMGRYIGALERLLIIILAMQGSFEALAFIVGAKSLIRYKRLSENEAFAEYFLVGTMASVLIGILLGLSLKAIWLP